MSCPRILYAGLLHLPHPVSPPLFRTLCLPFWRQTPPRYQTRGRLSLDLQRVISTIRLHTGDFLSQFAVDLRHRLSGRDGSGRFIRPGKKDAQRGGEDDAAQANDDHDRDHDATACRGCGSQGFRRRDHSAERTTCRGCLWMSIPCGRFPEGGAAEGTSSPAGKRRSSFPLRRRVPWRSCTKDAFPCCNALGGVAGAGSACIFR